MGTVALSAHEGIILAGGLSTRAGSYKMALKIKGTTIIGRCIAAMEETCPRIIVVGGHRIKSLSEIIGNRPGVEIVFNHNFKDGMFSSVKEGLRHVKAGRFFITPGDCPLISKEVYKKMAGIGGKIIVPMYEGKRGHPVLMDRCCAEEILGNRTCTNLREYIDRTGFTPIDIDEPGILEDIDTMKDYERIIRLGEKGNQGGV